MGFSTFAPLFADEEKAIEFVEQQVWPHGPECPHCTATGQQYRLQRTGKGKKGTGARPGLRKCGVCRRQYTVRVGTIFEDSKLPLRKWLYAISLMCASKKGVSANQLSRTLEISYKAAWFLCHRIREAMKQEPLLGMLGRNGGIVEIDETYVGGKPKNNLHRNRTKAAGKKTIVLTLVDREGEARTFPVPDNQKWTLQTIAKPIVDRSAMIITDSHRSYEGLHKHFAAHHVVDHSKQFVRAVIVHTNFAESYHSLLKRGLIGTFHHISEKHMTRYLTEFEFKWNSRKISDGERTKQAIKSARGKRLMYQKPTGIDRELSA